MKGRIKQILTNLGKFQWSCSRLAVAATFLLAAVDASSEVLRIVHIDVDQGDATLFVSPSGETMLVDSGKNGHGERLRAAMESAGVFEIDHLVITHYHEDHYGGADELTTGETPVPINHVHDRGDKQFLKDGKRAEISFRQYQDALGHRAHHLMRGETIPLDPAMAVTCLASGSVVLSEVEIDHGDHENDMSVVLLVQYGNFRYLVGGDVESHTERKLARVFDNLDVDVYQANHHGSDTSSAPEFLASLAPSLIVVSNGNNGRYQHPRNVTLDRYFAMTPRPTVIQTNKYLKGGDGANVADEFIADLDPGGFEGSVTVEARKDGSYSVRYDRATLDFESKNRSDSLGEAIIDSVLPNPLGPDRDLEEVAVTNVSDKTLDLSSWFLRDAAGRVWTLSEFHAVADGDTVVVRRAGMAMSLNNDGDTIDLVDASGAVRDRITYGNVAQDETVLRVSFQ